MSPAYLSQSQPFLYCHYQFVSIELSNILKKRGGWLITNQWTKSHDKMSCWFIINVSLQQQQQQKHLIMGISWYIRFSEMFWMYSIGTKTYSFLKNWWPYQSFFGCSSHLFFIFFKVFYEGLRLSLCTGTITYKINYL